MNDDAKELRGEVHRLAVALAELRAEVRDAIGLARWAGTLAVATLLTSGVGAVVWGASLTTKVYGMESRGNEKFQAVDARFDKLEAAINARFDKLEAMISRASDQPRPASPAAK